MRRIATTAIFLLLGATAIWAQAPQMPKPGPEHQKLHYFVGEWKSEGDLKPSPMGPGGKFTSTDHNQMLGDFFLLMHSQATGSMGEVNGVSIMGYDPKAKIYTYDGYNSMGEHETSTGTISGDTWNWLAPEQEMGGKKVKGRFTIKQVSATEYSYKYDISSDGDAWTNVMEGKATKQK